MKKPDIPLEEVGRLMLELKRHDGLLVLDERFDRELKELQIEINNEEKTGEETQKNKRALARLELVRPSVLVEDILKRAHAKLK